MSTPRITTKTTTTITLRASEEDRGVRLDVFLSRQNTAAGQLSRSAAANLIAGGAVSVGGRTATKNYRMCPSDTVVLTVPLPQTSEVAPEDIPLDVIYEDADVIVINKLAGMVVHPAAGNREGTLVAALLAHCGSSLSGVGGVIRPGIVHRIDKDTSGLLVAAKNDAAHLFLSERLKYHEVRRVYTALVCGALRGEEGTIDAPVGRSAQDRKRMAVIPPGDSRTARHAVTHWRVLERYSGVCGASFTLAQCRLETGRTHQIRVHMASVGHPLCGDTLYGGGRTKFERANAALLHGQCLHASELSFEHPSTGERMTFYAPLPGDFTALLEKLRSCGDVTII